MPVPEGKISASWQDAVDGHLLSLELLARSKSTITHRKCNISQLARHFSSLGTEPEHVTGRELARYISEQAALRSASGPRSFHRDVKGFFAWLAEDLGIPDPCAKVACPKGEAKVVPVVSWEGMQRALAACKGKTEAETARNQAILWLFLESGLRRFELSSLDLGDVDKAARTVQVRKGKGGKSRVSAYGPNTAQALRRWLRHRGSNPGPLFTTFLGDGITPSGVSQLFRRVAQRSGVTLRPHMLRHTWADAMLEAGVEGHDVMKLAGWSSEKMLLVYGAARAQERALEAGRSVQVSQVLKSRKTG